MKSDSTLQSNASLQPLRSYNRAWNQIRPVTLEHNLMKNADGSCLVSFGDTRVLCAATIEEGVPAWRRSSRAGWVTAEYAMQQINVLSENAPTVKVALWRSSALSGAPCVLL